MALISNRSDFYAPCVGKVIAATTAAVLHDADSPINCKHMPCGVIFHGAGNFVWKDVQGTTNTTVVPATATGLYVPIAPAELTVANAVPVTVFWVPSIRKV